MKANLKKSKEDVGKWSRWIGGGALVLALAGLLAPATASAVTDIGEEVIEIEGRPRFPLDSAELGRPYGGRRAERYAGWGQWRRRWRWRRECPQRGGSGPKPPPKPSPAEKRLANAKQDCQVLEGVWGSAVFNDIDTGIAFAGYSCRMKTSSNGQYYWVYYDSEGNINKRCAGDLDVQVCEAP